MKRGATRVFDPARAVMKPMVIAQAQRASALELEVRPSERDIA